MEQFVCTSPEETIARAKSFAGTLRRGDLVALTGDLGSGKTHFVKGVCEALGVCEQVTSPTFVLLNRYTGKDAGGAELFVYHFDLYRVSSTNEIYDLGYEEFLVSDGICLVEWAEVLNALLPEQCISVHMAMGVRENDRVINVERTNAAVMVHSARGRR